MKSVAPVLTVHSVREAVIWYGEVLGFEPAFVNAPEGPESAFYAVLSAGTVSIHLVRDAEMGNAAGAGACSFDVSNYAALLESCRTARTRFYIEPDTEIPDGRRSFGIHDPDGNRLAFIEASE